MQSYEPVGPDFVPYILYLIKIGCKGIKNKEVSSIGVSLNYKIPGDKTIEKVIITGDTVEKGVPAEIVRRNIA